ncbi:hypothetical protein BC826DRAFT_972966 [Russula brevipes]|nr:hypothetical protein BC826DRAFT_972966 [Russula brevipes]
MAPRTRRARIITEANHTIGPSDENSGLIQASTRKTRLQRNVASRDISDTSRNINIPVSKKRTISIHDDPASGEVEQQVTPNLPNSPSTAPPTKKARNAGSLLVLMSDDPVVNQQDEPRDERDDSVTKHKGKGKRPEIRNVDASDHSSSEAHSDNGDTETEVDWIDEQHLAELAEKQPSKFEESMRVERISWKGPGAIPNRSAAGGHAGTQKRQDQADTSSEHHGGAVPDTGLMLETSVPSWPAITNLCTAPGTNRVMLSVQVPLMRVIIQDMFDHVRAFILFDHAFPDPTLTATVPCARIPLFRSEVKERCSVLVASHFLSFNSAPEIAHLVERQTSAYNYTYPTAPNQQGPPMRSRPYCNARIISIIRELYFSGGIASFANRFHHRFPQSEDSNAVGRYEVPISMVALVATALYAAIREWHTGKHMMAEFSTNLYIDVYEGHVNTFLYIRDHCNNIYAQASAASKLPQSPSMISMAKCKPYGFNNQANLTSSTRRSLYPAN